MHEFWIIPIANTTYTRSQNYTNMLVGVQCNTNSRSFGCCDVALLLLFGVIVPTSAHTYYFWTNGLSKYTFVSNLKPRSILPRQVSNHKYEYLAVDLYSHSYFLPSSKRWQVVGLKALTATSSGVTYWELKSHLHNALVFPTFTYDIEIWRGDLKNSHWKVFQKGM